MNILFEQFLLKLFLALGDKFIKEGDEYFDSWARIKKAKLKAKDYEKKINDPNASLDDQLNANDEFGA